MALRARDKFVYALGGFVDTWGHWLFPAFAFQVFSQYLGVRPALVGIAVIVNRLTDGLCDPLFGWLSDNTRGRWGRRRPFLVIGAVGAGLGLPLLVAVPPQWGPANCFWYLLVSSVLYLPLVNCFTTPYQSLGYELTPDYHERTSLFAWKYLVQKLPEAGLFYAGQFLSLGIWAAMAGGPPNMLRGAQVFAALCGIVMVAAGLGCALLTPEPFYKRVLVARQGPVALRESLYETLRCQPFRLIVGVSVAYGLGLSMVGTLGLANTLYYVCRGDFADGYRWNFRMGLAGMAMGALGVPGFAWLARRWGKRAALAAVMVLGLATFAVSPWLYTPALPALQLAATGLAAFMGAGFGTVRDSICADVVDYDELVTRKRREGSFAASLNWITKAAMAVGAGFSFVILDELGLQSPQIGVQPARTLHLIRLCFAAVPMAGLALALVFALRFHLSETQMAGIRAQLEQRRGA